MPLPHSIAKRVLLLPLLLAAACASTLPAGRAETALYMDVRKAVELRESAEWLVDRIELEALAGPTMRSGCQVDAATRQRVIAWLDAQIGAAGGPAHETFARDPGADISAVLTLERVRAVVRYADEHAGECPFWLTPDPEFAGVQTDAYRLVLLLESVGGGGVIVSGGAARLGGGGGARVSLGVGLNPRYTLALGAEVGGIGSFDAANGGEGRALTGRFVAAVPLVLRIHHMSRVMDLEVAGVTRWTTDEIRTPPGFRAAIGYGISTLRLGAFMPSATARLSFEILPATNTLPAEYVFVIGSTVGFSIDP